MLEKLVKLGLIEKGQGLENVLSLNVTVALNRRLQTIIFKKGFADTPKHARQRVTHGHVNLGGRKMVFPSHIVSVEKEKTIIVKGGKKG